MGCCGQSYTDELVQGHTMPESTYGFNIFDKVQDEDKRQSIKEMLPSALDSMKDFHDYTETKLRKLLLANNDNQ
jgi:hypothetical protein